MRAYVQHGMQTWPQPVKLMLTGRMEWRRGLMVVVGAFIIFGAVSIVAGIRSLAQAGF